MILALLHPAGHGKADRRMPPLQLCYLL